MPTEDLKPLFTEIIQKQIVILGPEIAVLKARKVPGLEVSDDGTVVKIDGDPKNLLDQLIDEYVALSGLIVKKTLEPLLQKYQSENSESVTK